MIMGGLSLCTSIFINQRNAHSESNQNLEKKNANNSQVFGDGLSPRDGLSSVDNVADSTDRPNCNVCKSYALANNAPIRQIIQKQLDIY